MRPTLSLLVMSAWAVAAVAQAQTAATTAAVHARETASPQAVSPRAVSGSTAPTARHRARALEKPRPARSATGVTNAVAPTGRGSGVLALGASDITGNKELPKVMVIVPWKSPADAGGVVPPEDSVMNEVLGPVDRGVLQRRIRYYGQLDAAGEQPASRPVAPVGDSR